MSGVSGVNQVTATSSAPSTQVMRDFSLYLSSETVEQSVHHFNVSVDENYFKQMNIPIIAGRTFRLESDTSSWGDAVRKVIVNRQSIKELGLELDKAVGTVILTNWLDKILRHEIIGVVEDFHQFSLHQSMKPLLFVLPAQTTDYVFSIVSVSSSEIENATRAMANIWKQIDPNAPFESEFLNDSVKRQYENDQRVSKIFTVFTIITIVISCLGLYGLSVFMAERRVKEIGIRKVLGASVNSIVTMLSKDFIMLVAIAFVISVPVCYYAMDKWLQGFAYKTEMNVAVFLLAGLLAFTIAIITVGFESMKAAMGNPVDSLKNE